MQFSRGERNTAVDAMHEYLAVCLQRSMLVPCRSSRLRYGHVAGHLVLAASSQILKEHCAAYGSFFFSAVVRRGLVPLSATASTPDVPRTSAILCDRFSAQRLTDLAR